VTFAQPPTTTKRLSSGDRLGSKMRRKRKKRDRKGRGRWLNVQFLLSPVLVLLLSASVLLLLLLLLPSLLPHRLSKTRQCLRGVPLPCWLL